MKVFLTTLNSKFIHSNLAIRYLAAYCRDLPVQMELTEFNINQQQDYILAQIYKAAPDILGFSCYIWNIESTLELCSNLRKILPEVKIILGGPEVSFDAEKIMADHPYIDYIVRGEGEVTFRELLEKLLQLSSKTNPADILIPGLTARVGEQILSGPERPLIANLDDIPSPFLEGSNTGEDFANKLVYYESCRGCPFNCQYCLSSTFRGVRTFSIERIKADLRKLIKAGVGKVKFVDRTFNFDPAHALEILRFLLESPQKTTFHFEITAHLLSDEILELLKEAPVGLFQFEIGVQSTHQPTLRAIKRADDFARLQEVVRVVAGYRNIHLHLDLIAGLPGEDYATFQQSFNDVFNLHPDDLQLGFLKLLKGSGIRMDAEKHGYRYTDRAPYEILSNDLISFGEILELKMVEDLLETYYNSHKFEMSLEFIIKRFYEKQPFTFFKDFKDYWEMKGYHHRPHKDITLYQILQEFYLQQIEHDTAIFLEYLKFDFLRNIRTSVLPDWLTHVEVLEYKARVYQFVNNPMNIAEHLPNLEHLDYKQILRRIHIEPFEFDLFQYRQQDFQGDTARDTIFILFDYEERDPIFNQVKYFQVQI